MELVGTTYPAGSVRLPELITKYRAMGIPTTFFNKPDGSVFETWNGFIRRGQLMELIDASIWPRRRMSTEGISAAASRDPPGIYAPVHKQPVARVCSNRFRELRRGIWDGNDDPGSCI